MESSKKTNRNAALKNPRLWVEQWFDTQRLTAQDALTREGLFNSLYIDYEMVPKYKNKPFGIKLLKAAFEEYITDRLTEQLSKVAEVYNNQPADDSHLLAWVQALTGAQKKLDVLVMKHWLWQVKRKAAGLEVVYHIMPILFGAQGTGKSMAVRKLISPLSRFEISMPLHELADSRNYRAMAYNLIYFADELQSIQRTDINALKNQLTTTHNNYRPMYTTFTVKIPQSCSFIGCSNRHIDEMIYDSTGMRRFYEINVPGQTDFEAINKIDYVALWKGIDETAASPLSDVSVQTELRAWQENLVQRDDVDLFIEETDLRPSGDKKQLMLLTDIYRAFVTWQATNGSRLNLTSHAFSKRLQNRGFLSTSQHRRIYFYVNFATFTKMELVK